MSRKPMESARRYLPPWRERLPSGELGPKYGPAPSTLARKVARFRLWSYRPPPRTPLDARIVVPYMRPEGSLRPDIPESERTAYLLVYEEGYSVRAAARAMRVSRDSVRSYLRRLRAKAQKEG